MTAASASPGPAPPTADAPPRRGLAERLAIGVCLALIRLYQLTLSYFIGGFCRFQPTCSRYAAEALRRHGLFRGLALGAWRICRCQPWGGSGYDPVPPARER